MRVNIHIPKSGNSVVCLVKSSIGWLVIFPQVTHARHLSVRIFTRSRRNCFNSASKEGGPDLIAQRRGNRDPGAVGDYEGLGEPPHVVLLVATTKQAVFGS